MITQYVTGEVGEHEMLEIVIVPQSADQLYAVESILPGVVAKEARGGMGLFCWTVLFNAVR